MMLCSKKFKKRKASTTNVFQASSALLWRDTLCKIIVFSTLIEIYFFDLAVFIFINKLLRGHFNNIVKWYFDYRSLVLYMIRFLDCFIKIFPIHIVTAFRCYFRLLSNQL